MKSAVFTTSDIFRLVYSDWGQYTDDLELKYTLHDGSRVYSTGVLERALASGHDVYVMSTRKALGAHDAWWADLLPSENITIGVYGTANDGEMGATDTAYIAAWRALAVRLGLDPDSFRRRRELGVLTEAEMEGWKGRMLYGPSEDEDEDARELDWTWMDYMYALARHVASADDFEPPPFYAPTPAKTEPALIPVQEAA